MLIFLSLCLSPNQIVFEGIRGPSFEGDIAIDDVSITMGKCKQETSVASTGKMTLQLDCKCKNWRYERKYTHRDITELTLKLFLSMNVQT